MAGLHITTSNMMEILAARLADVMADPLTSPLSQEIVLINSRGMERWLSMQLAEHHGVCANLSFQFPRPFLLALLQNMTGTLGGSDLYHPDCLTWKVMKILPEISNQPGFETIRHYLDPHDGGDSRKRYQLSRRIARVFDQYLGYRPEMILNWEAGRIHHKDEVWQSALWRALQTDITEPHPVALHELFRRKGPAASSGVANLPERISLIGISALPPLFIDVILTLAALTDVHLFLFNPCREYWSEVLSEREMENRMQHLRLKTDGVLAEEELFLEKGNPLLASMGKISRDFLFAFVDATAQHQDFFVRPGESTLLRTVQSDILNLVDRSKGEAEPLPFLKSDRSIECHSCHSPLREVEVLHDRLLSLFENNPGLKPRDILVMTPDIDTYAPLIESVFDRLDEETLQSAEVYIPFSIADRRHLRNNPVTDTFFKILDLADSRFEASRVLALLDRHMIRSAFHITEDETALIRRWVDETGIRWGIDNDSLLDLDLPQMSRHTWRHGIDRMLLGYALPGEKRGLFQDRLPYDGIEGERAEVLGRFLDFLACLFAVNDRLRGKHTLKEWQAIFDALCAQFLHIGEEDELLFHHRHLLDTLHALSNAEATSGYLERLPLAVIRDYLTEQLEGAGFSGGFLSGGVTFCAMVPMRSIPFQVICLLGMNQGQFPRESTRLGFDLIERHHRRGDRSKRDDDRYLFLETLLSARDRLMIFYTGQSIRDNTLIPPSVVVAELLDYLEQSFFRSPDTCLETGKQTSAQKAIRKHLVTTHPLQPFSPVYFSGDPQRYSYSHYDCRAAQSLMAHPEIPGPFLSSPLPLDSELLQNIGIEDLKHFFRHPTRYFIEKRLGVKLRKTDEKSDDWEDFTLSGLSRYGIAQNMLDSRVNAAVSDQEYQILLEAGQLPLGAIGQCNYQCLMAEIDHFAGQVGAFQPEAKREEIHVDLTLDDIRLTGLIILPSPRGFFSYRYADLKGKDYLNAWILHLFLSAVAPERPWRNCLVGRKDWVLFDTPHDAKTILMKLLGVFKDGLTRPLPFFPQASLQYAVAVSSGTSRQEALSAARKVWRATDFSRGEEDDPYYRLCFGKTDPLDETFCTLSEVVYNPVLAHRLAFADADLLQSQTAPITLP